MCGIAGVTAVDQHRIEGLQHRLDVMGRLIAHRGPDGDGTFTSAADSSGLAHRRLAIIDLTEHGAQPMTAPAAGTTIAFNGEIYNYKELTRDLSSGGWRFRSASDTECILALYDRYGDACVDHLRGMFAFALWDERRKRMLLARDRFGIKPLYYAVVDGVLYFASEAKALLPFLPEISTDPGALAEYLTFQYTLGDQTLFTGVRQLMPGHTLVVEDGEVRTHKYWDVQYTIDHDHSPAYFGRQLVELLEDSIDMHLRSDVEVGAYMSGGLDSSLMAMLAAKRSSSPVKGFHGRFTQFPGYDESVYASLVAESAAADLSVLDITAADFEANIAKVLYHLDFPVAGPGSFPQYMVSQLAAQKVKVVLGGQGGDEIFGGYARYLVAYLEQCIKAAIDGTYTSGNFVVTIESIVPNLGILREYKPLIKQFWADGLFGPLDRRYLRLIDRSADMADEVRWAELDRDKVTESFDTIFNSRANVSKEAYFDRMTHFEFKTLLPALLQVEDRMSMAHGLESRVPLLDHPLVEFAATVPADVKFEGGQMKHLIKTAFADVLPSELIARRDKMGFPVPLKEWFGGELDGFVHETFRTSVEQDRPFLDARRVLDTMSTESQFSRKTWGLLSLELWHQQFHDNAAHYRSLAR